MLSEKPDAARPQRVEKATAPEVNVEAAPATKVWYRLDCNVKAFLTTKQATRTGAE